MQLTARKELPLEDKTHRYLVATRRWDLLLSDQAYDVFAVDSCYHQSCYIKFAITPVTQEEKEEEEKQTRCNKYTYL